MKTRLLLLLFLTSGFVLGADATNSNSTAAVPDTAKPAPPAPPRKQATKEEIEARLAEHARKHATHSAVEKKAPSQLDEPSPAAVAAANAGKSATGNSAAAEPEKTVPESAQVLPKVEVRNGRVTELDIQVAKQNVEIAREKQNTKPTALDETLNGPKISSALALFGGQSSEDRANVAKERVAMMEDERNIIEAIAQAQTKEEKTELENLLIDMKATRRELEKSLK